MILNKMIVAPVVSAPSYNTIIVVVPYNTGGPVYISTDLGANWTNRSVIGSTNSIMHNCVMGDCILVGRSGASTSQEEYSTDLWVNKAQISPGRAYPQCLVISYNGQAFAINNGNAYLLLSYNKGTSWSEISTPASCVGIAMNSTGSKIYLASSAQATLRYTVNSGVNWSNTATLMGTGLYFYGIAMSSDGNYIYAGAYNNGDRIARSTDGGSNWSTVLVGTRTTGNSAVRCFCSANGQYVLFHTHSGYNYVSNDYGVNWTRVLSSYTYTYNFSKAVSNSGQYMVLGDYTNNNTFYYSDDYGVTWSVKSVSGITVPIRSVSINENI